MVFQNPDNQLVADVVEEDVAFGPENLGIPAPDIEKRIEESLQAAGMTAWRYSSPSRLSGGQKQRVAIAGMLAMRPRCLIMDEPTSMLDPQGVQSVMDAIQSLNRDMGITILLITHDPLEAMRAERVIVMDRGHIAMDASPREVFSRPAELEKMHILLPQTMQLADLLRQGGMPLPAGIMEAGELAEAAAALLSDGGGSL